MEVHPVENMSLVIVDTTVGSSSLSLSVEIFHFSLGVIAGFIYANKRLE
jgi:hypothetical protein